MPFHIIIIIIIIISFTALAGLGLLKKMLPVTSILGSRQLVATTQFSYMYLYLVNQS